MYNSWGVSAVGRMLCSKWKRHEDKEKRPKQWRTTVWELSAPCSACSPHTTHNRCCLLSPGASAKSNVVLGEKQACMRTQELLLRQRQIYYTQTGMLYSRKGGCEKNTNGWKFAFLMWSRKRIPKQGLQASVNIFATKRSLLILSYSCQRGLRIP